ncbi:hypothetical protein CFC21_061582 [Triticum aestivum]|uniref:Uncharacterized protein n=2 Tax=Triticum aestivum TaxID=4565 RepID=A0A9R1GWK4_WHEAT|nr:hypothetical protein CFC21_010781 [Triticum aestivum]KAF7053731.1 hypothetical protein CFC21_061582 [Triticum aestivum]
MAASTRRHYSDDPTRPHGSGKTDVCSMGFLRSWQNRRTHRRRHPLTSARCIVHVCSPVIAHFFCASGFVQLHHPRRPHHRPRLHHPDRLPRHRPHGYVYSNSSATTPVNSVRVVTSVHVTSVVTAGGNRGEGMKAPEGDAVTTLGANPSETQLMMAQWRRRRKRKTSNPVVLIRFTPATTEGEC